MCLCREDGVRGKVNETSRDDDDQRGRSGLRQSSRPRNDAMAHHTQFVMHWIGAQLVF